MDRLRRRSVNFTNAHVVVPVCGPSRKCMFSGLYPQTLNDYGFAAWKSVPSLRDCVPLPLHFRNNGYNSYGTGKLLHEGAGGDFYSAYGIGPDYGPWSCKGKNTPHPAQFDTWKEHLPVNMHRDLNYAPLSNVPHCQEEANKEKTDNKGWYYGNGQPFRYVDDNDRDKMPDEISADWAIDILKKKHNRPFYLGVGFIRPHTPLYAPKKYFDMFPLEEVQLPPYRKNDLNDCASVLRERWQWGFKKYHALIKAGGEKAWKEWVQAYLACTAFVDDQIGKVLNALDAGPYRDNAIVVLTGDNGYHVGEKDCIQKWHLWDESTRVPLFIRLPGQKGSNCDHPVSLIDIYPTLTDCCALPDHPNKGRSNKKLEGRSLKPLLKNPEGKGWKNGRSVAFMGIRDDANPHFSVRSRRYRYTLCGNAEEELYDHKNDPHEWTNLASDPEYADIKKRHRGQLMTILRATTTPKGF